MYNRYRYNDYYLVADEPTEDVGFDEKKKKSCTKKAKIMLITMYV